MGIALALLSMLCFGANIIISRYAVARMAVEPGFVVVLGANLVLSAALFGAEFAARAAPFSWDWSGAGLFALGGVIGTFLGRRLLYDTVRLIGPARASVFHSSAPLFSLVAAWLLIGERLGAYELALMALVWTGLWLTTPAGGVHRLPREAWRKGAVLGVLTVAGFGFGNAVRGVAMRDWDEAVFGTVVSTVAAIACQAAATRDWGAMRAAVRSSDKAGIALFAASGIATALGSVFMALAMARMEIALAALVMHTTPLLVFPYSVLVLRNREGLTGRTLAGAAVVLAGIAALALR
jgi:drug/metabolite transporter (DMT)-like permease